MDCSLPGSFAHGILQARVLEWVAMPSSTPPCIHVIKFLFDFLLKKKNSKYVVKIALLLYLSQACQQETTWKRQQQK